MCVFVCHRWCQLYTVCTRRSWVWKTFQHWRQLIKWYWARWRVLCPAFWQPWRPLVRPRHPLAPARTSSMLLSPQSPYPQRRPSSPSSSTSALSRPSATQRTPSSGWVPVPLYTAGSLAPFIRDSCLLCRYIHFTDKPSSHWISFISLLRLDVGIVSDGLCLAQSQSDAGPLWVSRLLPCHPVCCTLHPLLPLHQVIHTCTVSSNQAAQSSDGNQIGFYNSCALLLPPPRRLCLRLHWFVCLSLSRLIVKVTFCI